MRLPGNLLIPSLFSTTLLILSCHDKPDLVAEKETIRNMLATERKAHFDRNVDLFISEFADSMISVNKGKVTIAGPAQNKKRIEPYFNSVTFIKWDDTAEPIIRIADDGSLAYAIIQKEVILTYPDSLGKPFYDTTHYAWTSIYRKQKGEWKVEANTSTNK
jgi:hypothetical protein